MVTSAPRARRSSEDREWLVDVPIYIEIRIGGVRHGGRGEVHIIAVEQPNDDRQPFKATETRLEL